MSITITDLRKEIGNLAVAVFLNCQFVRSFLDAIIPSFTAHGIRFVIIVSAVLFLLSIRKLSFRIGDVLIPVVVVLYYLITSILFPGKSAVTFFEVFSYVIMPFLLVMLDIDIRKIVKWTLIITAPVILVSDQIFTHTLKANAITMLLSYSVLFSSACGLSYLLYYRRYDRRPVRILFIILCIPQAYYTYEMVLFGSRGPALSLLVLLVLILFFKPKNNNDYVNRRFSTFAVFVSIAFALIAVFFEDILMWTNDFLIRHNIVFRSIIKSIRLYQEADLSHGRIAFYITALQGFVKSPLFGHGFDVFYANTGFIYPHNFILQLAYDGGIILLLFVLHPVIRSSIRIFGKRNYSLLVPWILLFSSSVVGALFSGDLWMRYNLWFFFAYCIRYGRKMSVITETRSSKNTALEQVFN